MSRLRPADVLAGIGGVVLLGSLFLKWYGFDASALTDRHVVPVAISQFAGRAARSLAAAVPSLTAWQAFSIIDVLLAAIALLAIALPIVTALARGPAKPVAFAVLTSVFGLLAVLLVLFRLVDQPGNDQLVAVKAGAYVGLAGALLTFAGGWLALADERTPGAVPPQVPRRPAPRAG
jgi:hypothetical protein